MAQIFFREIPRPKCCVQFDVIVAMISRALLQMQNERAIGRKKGEEKNGPARK